jgi:hypothetical protein
MLLFLGLGCLVDRAAYDARRAALTDDDGDGVTEVDGDCADDDGDVFPGAPERCNGADDDCDGQADEAEDVDVRWFADADEDGFGGASEVAACDAPDGFVTAGGDCDDTDGERFPGAVERCNGVDDDCDDEVDDPADVEPLAWYPDADADGYGDGEPIAVCADPGGAALLDGDCDDADGAVNPGATETCNGLDDDCNGVEDDAPAVTWYLDRDEDGFGDDDDTYLVCTPPPGYVRSGGDCDDLDPERSPRADEVCEDGVDGDCDGLDGTCGLDAGALGADDMSARFSVSGTEAYVARSVASAGDLDGDGDDELLVARPGWAAFTGAVALVAGGPDLYLGDRDLDADATLVTGASGGAAFGYAVSGGGDTDGDGTGDLLVSALFDDRVYLFTDGAAALRGGLDSGDADLVLVGPGADASFGVAVALLGDLDGDGLGDWAIGDYLYGDTGAAFLYYGTGAGGGREVGVEDGVELRATRLDAQAGQELCALGDLDGDGQDEFFIGENKVSSSGETSFAYVYFGTGTRVEPGDLADAPLVLEGTPSDGAFAESAALGDVDGDGRADAAFTAPERDASSGAVFIMLGSRIYPSAAALETIADVEWAGATPGIGIGASVGGPGDLDGDGYADIAASGVWSGATLGGHYVLGGRPGISGTYDEFDARATVTGGNTEAEGDGVAGAADLNGDGSGELFFSAWDAGSMQGQAWLVYGGP